jgi:hypothetical protein
MSGAIPSLPIRLHGVVLSKAQGQLNFTLPVLILSCHMVSSVEDS